MANKNNENGYILNTNSGTLHTKECGMSDEVCGASVTAGSQKHYLNYNNATQSESYKKDHEAECCIGK